MAQKTRAQLKTQSNSLVPDNTSGLVDPVDVRTTDQDGYDSAVNIIDDTSDVLTEGTTNLYFTDQRAIDALKAALSVTSPLFKNDGPSTITLGIQPANDTNDGYLLATDFAAFQNKENFLTFNNPLSRSGNTISLLLDTDPFLSANSNTVVPSQRAIKSFVENALQGLSPKTACDCATTADITLSGEQTIDGFTTSASRVLVKDQSLPEENGIYVSAAGAWTRSTDMDADLEINGAYTVVINGTLNAGNGYVANFPTGSILGTDPIVWNLFSTNTNNYVPLSGTTMNVDADLIFPSSGTTQLVIDAINSQVISTSTLNNDAHIFKQNSLEYFDGASSFRTSLGYVTPTANRSILLQNGSGTLAFLSDITASTITGTLPINKGGTGEVTASAALNALLPSQTGNNGKALVTNGTTASWQTVSGGGGGGTWGSITGTLSDQTDLQAALDAKLNTSGGALTGLVTNTTDYKAYFGTAKEIELGEEVLEGISTGLYKWTSPGLAIGSPTTDVVVSAGSGHIMNWHTDPNNPTYTTRPWIGQTITITAANGVTFLYVDSAGTVQQTTTALTSQQKRENIFLGRAVTIGGVVVQVVPTPYVITSPMNQLSDFMDNIGLINLGVNVTAASTNLTIKNSAGVLISRGANFITNAAAPNSVNILLNNPTTFAYITQLAGSTGANTTNIVPGSYDVAGTITAIPGSSNQATNQYIYAFPSGNFRVAYGQVIYSTLADAIIGAASESFTENPSIAGNGILIGIISVTKGCTNLANTSTARFLPASKFGERAVGGSGQSVTSLQGAYLNSLDGKITTDTTRTAVKLQRGTAADTDNVLEILNGAGSTAASINGNGLITGFTTTQTLGTNTTQLASTAFVQQELGSRFNQNGNSFGSTAVLGTNDAFNLEFETNNAVRGRFLTAANTGNVDSTFELLALGTGNGIINTNGTNLSLRRGGTALVNFNGTRNADWVGGNWTQTFAGTIGITSQNTYSINAVAGNVTIDYSNAGSFRVRRSSNDRLVVTENQLSISLGSNNGPYNIPFNFGSLAAINIPIASEGIVVNFPTNSIQYNNSGSLALQRTYRFGQQTVSSTTATFTITTAGTLVVEGAPIASTNVAITDALAFLSRGGRNKFIGDVSIGLAEGTVMNASAALEISSTTKGLLLPRMTTAQRTAMANVAGMMVYDTDTGKSYTNDGTTWNAHY